MTDERKELIERWAREAGFDVYGGEITLDRVLLTGDPPNQRAELERFAALVRADDDRILRASVPERWKDCASAIGAVQSYIAELEGAVSRARADALEEAATVCEAIDDECPDCAAHNEHEQCYIPPASAYADAIRKLIQAP